jgi:hypothetical protein
MNAPADVLGPIEPCQASPKAVEPDRGADGDRGNGRPRRGVETDGGRASRAGLIAAIATLDDFSTDVLPPLNFGGSLHIRSFRQRRDPARPKSRHGDARPWCMAR